ncbi:DNA topoisomerase 1 [Bacteroidales bacterium]|nr:DNA topoisomerase 1 [Bacteroidales bacterium]
MQKNLVIVESPAKGKTIEKFLGPDFKVLSSYGHIRDLKDKGLGIEIENNFKPIYVVSADKEAVVNSLKKEVKAATTVWLASDEDREGEAIAWHLYETLGLDKKETKRIVFHEITKNAILHAVENPRDIDYNLVDAQQARRVLDRIVGFELSPILWKKIGPSLSAGRVQSVAVRLIVEREREINAHQAEVSYRVLAQFVLSNGHVLKAELGRRLKTLEEARALFEQIKNASFSVEDVTTKPAKKSPAPPFTTSTLQQEASRKMGFSVSQTMSVAQKLYEAGHISYMRTDSVNLSNLAIAGAKSEIEGTFGEEYFKMRTYQTKSKGAQEAHEAIRPTYMDKNQVKGSAQEQRLYELIWKRTLASQMADAQLERTVVSVAISNNNKEKFFISGEVIKFDGFLRVYLEGHDEENSEDGDESIIPPMLVDSPLSLLESTATERLSQRPARYGEASLVRKLEELGIGRPSTYAPTISTIQNRGYVIKGNKDGIERDFNILRLTNDKISEEIKVERVGADKGKLMPTDTGLVVTDFLTESFPTVLNYSFTADIEKEFDKVADGEVEWTNTIGAFYEVFHPIVEEVAAAKTAHKIGERILGTDPKTGKPISVKIGRYGPFAQIGHADDEEKPLFASLMKDQSIETISIEEALKLFAWPINLGLLDEKDVTVAIGRFGPFIKYDGAYTSIPKEYNPATISLQEAEILILEKKKKDAERLIKSFSQDENMQLLNGRYGPYLAFEKGNYKLPKDKVPADLTYEECLKIIEDAPEKTKARAKAKAAKPAAKGKAAKAKTAKPAAKTKAKASPKAKAKVGEKAKPKAKTSVKSKE